MHRRQTTLLVLSMAALIAAGGPATRAADALPAPEKWIPRKALIVLNVRKPKALLDFALQPKLVEAVKSSPAYKAQAGSEGFRQFLNVIEVIEGRFAADWQTVLRRLLGGGAILAVGPNKGNLIIIDSLDAAAPKELHEFVLAIARSNAEKSGQSPDSIQATKVGDVDTWPLGPKQIYAVLGKRIVIASSPNVMKAALDLRAGADGASVTSLPAYRQAVKAAGDDAAAVLYVNTGVLKQAPQIAAALAGNKEPLASLLAGPLLEAVSKSTWAAVALRAKGETLTLDAITDGVIASSGVGRFALPAEASDGALPNLVVPRRIAAMSLHRDLRGFYGAKDQLFPERTSGLIFFENMMGIFFTGRDLTEEVLAETGPKVRLVVAEQKYDPAIGTPATQFPAFALVLPMKRPEKFAIVVEEAWQKAIGLVNFTRGQQAEPGLIIDRPVYRGTKYTVAAFVPPDDRDKKALDPRFNFRPTLAMPGKHLIFSSTDALAEDIMAALAKEAARPAKPQAGLHSTIEIDGAQLASILEANRENLIRKNMVDKGNTRAQAEGEMGLFLTAVKYVSRVVLTVATDKGRSKASVRLQLDIPAGGSGGK
jgi:hypothetical protein